jgi:hypothetical protein
MTENGGVERTCSWNVLPTGDVARGDDVGDAVFYLEAVESSLTTAALRGKQI